jgi:predicted P-loop ATPase
MRDSPTKTSMLDWALRYIRLGWPVLPLRGKLPRTKNGSKDATLNEDQARAWWKEWPDANIGVATGLRFFALDIDIKDGGEDSFEHLFAQHGAFPDTIQQITGTGGKHLLFALPDFPVRNSARKIAPGIDVRGAGGYIVAAPSAHPDTGRQYFWDGLALLEEQKLSPAPRWLLDFLRADMARGGQAKAAKNVPARISEGARNQTLFRIAASLRRKGFSAEEILATLRVTNMRRCAPELEEKELSAIANSAGRYAPDARGTLFPAVEKELPLPGAAGKPDKLPLSDGGKWKCRLICEKAKNGTGAPRALLANAVTAFRNAPEWKGVLAYNEFSLGTVMRRPAVFGGQAGAIWTDHEDRLATDWLQHQGIFVGVEVGGQAVQVAARDDCFHPVKDYLHALKWDGVKRIDGWLSLYLGVEATNYSAAVGERWLRSAIARIMQPGCKADCCLILEGAQGTKKSTALKALAWPWFSDELAEIGSKDAALQTRGVWLIEVAELEAMTRAEVGKIKAFMSRAVDRFRPPYGRHLLESPRQCVFAGSVNHGAYLRDDTGGRRFWPVACTDVRVPELERDRDQLWAEALRSYQSGDPWWLETPALNRQAEDEQSGRYEENAWHDLILTWCEQRIGLGETSVSVAEILDLCVHKRMGEWSRSDEMRVAACLTRAKWQRYRDWSMGNQRRYRPPVA